MQQTDNVQSINSVLELLTAHCETNDNRTQLTESKSNGNSTPAGLRDT